MHYVFLVLGIASAVLEVIGILIAGSNLDHERFDSWTIFSIMLLVAAAVCKYCGW